MDEPESEKVVGNQELEKQVSYLNIQQINLIPVVQHQ